MPAVCDVVDLVERAAGTIVRLRLLPRTAEQYRKLVLRIGA